MAYVYYSGVKADISSRLLAPLVKKVGGGESNAVLAPFIVLLLSQLLQIFSPEIL
jgi:hypothetical protein